MYPLADQLDISIGIFRGFLAVKPHEWMEMGGRAMWLMGGYSMITRQLRDKITDQLANVLWEWVRQAPRPIGRHCAVRLRHFGFRKIRLCGSCAARGVQRKNFKLIESITCRIPRGAAAKIVLNCDAWSR